LAAYEPILEQQVKLANNPAEMEKEAKSWPSSFDDEKSQGNEMDFAFSW
jgi:hypothetical protein